MNDYVTIIKELKENSNKNTDKENQIIDERILQVMKTRTIKIMGKFI